MKSDEISRDQLLYLIWRLLHTSGETQWQAMVYLFHDDAAASTRPSSHAEKFLESHQTAQMLSMLTLLAVENACALLPPETATAFQSRYAGNIGHASIAAWIAQNQIGARVTGGVLARWAAECTCEDWAGVLGERLLLRALAAHEGGQMPMAVQGTDDDGGGAAAARAHSSCSPARVPPAPERAGVGEMEEASTGDSMVYGMVAGLMPVLDVRSNILSAEAVFALRPWLPGGGAQGLRRLYSSQADGHSLVRLGHCVNGYKGETLMLFKDELQRVVAILNHQPWRDSPMFQVLHLPPPSSAPSPPWLLPLHVLSLLALLYTPIPLHSALARIVNICACHSSPHNEHASVPGSYANIRLPLPPRARAHTHTHKRTCRGTRGRC